ncbi:MAG: putative 4,5-dihydroxyphthalate dehydrogenase [Pelotomaculum sp. PtaU1.Bin035]|nr:MAG: putative 4,5-dihydroxyphthalate dehydrogenase [Pelotomaculum sp. PtaU1.Bin035]
MVKIDLFKMGQYKSAIIGLGQVGLMYDFDLKRKTPSSHTLAYQIHPRIELVAATDNRIEQVKYLQQIAPRVEFYQNIYDMLKQHHVDIVSICTPPNHHLAAIEAILRFSSPRLIFCEKPVVSHLDEVPQLYSLIKNKPIIFLPNLSRRWSTGMRRVRECIMQDTYGALQKIHARYTRGIFNTGSHLFDIIRWFAGSIEQVQVVEKVPTSSDQEGEPSYTFVFTTEHKKVSGFAEAFKDEQYYLFELDLYFERGKIDIRLSGDSVIYYGIDEHPLFSGFNNLKLQKNETGLLAESTLQQAVDHIIRVLDGIEQPACTLEDGIYPLLVANALVCSYQNNGSKEKVEGINNE